jgi:hypothetical protein
MDYCEFTICALHFATYACLRILFYKLDSIASVEAAAIACNGYCSRSARNSNGTFNPKSF